MRRPHLLLPVPDPDLTATPDGGARPSAEHEIDALLVERARGGDAEAWARLYQRHFDPLHRDLLYLVEQTSIAEELVQEAFAIALVSLARFDARASFRTWLRGIAHNLVRKHWRGRARRDRAHERVAREAPLRSPLVVDDPEAMHVRSHRARVLSEVLRTLPDALREVFVMRDVQGLAVEEVAERLQISPGNVRVRANRARSRIRAELARLGWLEGGVT
jgi:RNA polymerase sigma-70 factor, ECF subfamily